MNCSGCLKESLKATLCTKCRKELFDGEKISLQLDFAIATNDGNEALIKKSPGSATCGSIRT